MNWLNNFKPITIKLDYYLH